MPAPRDSIKDAKGSELKVTAKTCVVFSCLVLAIAVQSLCAADAKPDDLDIGADPVAAELSELGQEFQRLSKAQIQARSNPNDGGEQADDKLSDEEWLRQGQAEDAKTPDPDTEMLPRLLAFAKKHPDSPFAFDALFFVIRRGGPQTGDVHGKPWQIKEQSLDTVWADHMKDPRLVHLLEELGGSLPSRKTESFLRRAMEAGPDRSVQAAAGFHLARYYHTLASAHNRSETIKDKQRLLNFERYWKIVVTPYLEKNFPLDEEKNAEELERLLAVTIEEYADIQATDWELTGPHRIFLRTVPAGQPKTFADRASAMLFELNNIVPGKPAPDIEGTDADGKSFRLSDYRGKVVLLTFSADWCGGCVQLYPIQRNLLEKFRDQPFVILSVSRDDKIETLKSSIASGEIEWRCWWDGYDGPIRSAWNCRGIPDIFLLDDQHIIQDAHITRFSRQEEFERAIETLLRKVRVSPAP